LAQAQALQQALAALLRLAAALLVTLMLLPVRLSRRKVQRQGRQLLQPIRAARQLRARAAAMAHRVLAATTLVPLALLVAMTLVRLQGHRMGTLALLQLGHQVNRSA
jgi:hypothetical protein